MKIYIITPTHKRPEELLRSMRSVLDQTYTGWEMIIVNDSPFDTAYEKTEKEIRKDPRIIYLKNEKNEGVNFSRNRALDLLKEMSEVNDWIIFLDDDDTLAKDALETLVEIHKKNPAEKWILTNRASYEGKSFTKIPFTDREYSYVSGFLIARKLKGDATHFIKAEETKDIRFPKYVRQGEEWLFYYQLALKVRKFFYHNHNCTLSFGYSENGLNLRKRNKKERLQALFSLVRESYLLNIIWHPTMLLYLGARGALALFK